MLMALLAYCGEMCTLSYFSRVRMGFGRRVLPLLFSQSLLCAFERLTEVLCL